MSRQLEVYLESEPSPLGVLESDDFGALSFQYTPGAALSISISMPLRDEPYGDVMALSLIHI